MSVVQIRGWVPDPSEDFGARLALVRQRCGWNRKQAAELCGIDPATWAGWELRGVKPRGLEVECRKIAEASGADYVWLMTGYVPAQRSAQVTGDYVARIIPFQRRGPVRSARPQPLPSYQVGKAAV